MPTSSSSDVCSVRLDFAAWGASLSGCSGGILRADLWICGIEPSNGTDERYEELRAEIGAGPIDELPDRGWEQYAKSSYGRWFSKLAGVVAGGMAGDYGSAGAHPEVETLGLNLFPLPFTSTRESLWDERGAMELTGIPSKALYKAWCGHYRFSRLCALATTHEPRVIVCSGTTMLSEFARCFAGGGGFGSMGQGEITAGKASKKYYWFDRAGRRTTVFVIPFLGWGGLGSNEAVQQMGDKIRDLTDWQPRSGRG